MTRFLGHWPAGPLILTLLFVAVTLKPLGAQEIVGRRLFVDQLVISEPFVEDELSLPSLLYIRRRRAVDQPLAQLINVGAELKKRITGDLEVSLSGGLTHLDLVHDGSVTGFDNLEIGLKYQVLRNEVHEAVAALALSWEVGGTGRSTTGAEPADTVRPAVLFGKGLGDLSERLALFRPLALSGLAGFEIPTTGRPNVLTWGAVVEYSLPYLESFVTRIDLPRPLDRFVPLIEVDLHTDLSGDAGRVRGTLNPGVVWAGTALQIGAEAVAPLDGRIGKGVGVRGFFRIRLEALFGERAGRPILGAR